MPILPEPFYMRAIRGNMNKPLGFEANADIFRASLDKNKDGKILANNRAKKSLVLLESTADETTSEAAVGIKKKIKNCIENKTDRFKVGSLIEAKILADKGFIQDYEIISDGKAAPDRIGRAKIRTDVGTFEVPARISLNYYESWGFSTEKGTTKVDLIADAFSEKLAQAEFNRLVAENNTADDFYKRVEGDFLKIKVRSAEDLFTPYAEPSEEPKQPPNVTIV